MMRRRDLIALMGGTAGSFALAGLPGAVFAAAPTEHRFVVVLLRGALDGLAAVPPYGDPRYAEKRGAIALKPPGEDGGAIRLDGHFALHPGLAALEPYYRGGELLIVHASGNGYRTRSHFDAQDLMECGLADKRRDSDGWLNRALALMHAGAGARRTGLAVGAAVPLLLRGKVAVASWEPETIPAASPDFLASLRALYHGDPLFGPALEAGLKAQDFSADVLGDTAMRAKGGYGPGGFRPLAEAAGRLLAAPDGPRVAALEMGGWDTHVNEGAETGRLAQNLAGLAAGLDALAKAMGPAWRQTVLVAVTEFGRTVAVNGNNGTDHGTASVLLVLGGAVKGGRFYGDWPGLDRL
ncbi:MAG TPA: DUF1501 domain-containing protein, partial [Stellaceae bacterium]|nr:DUF1501 domain-containing protein [Stellaceae bacterium]